MSFPFYPNRGLIIVSAELRGPSSSAVLKAYKREKRNASKRT